MTVTCDVCQATTGEWPAGRTTVIRWQIRDITAAVFGWSTRVEGGRYVDLCGRCAGRANARDTMTALADEYARNRVIEDLH